MIHQDYSKVGHSQSWTDDGELKRLNSEDASGMSDLLEHSREEIDAALRAWREEEYACDYTGGWIELDS